MEERTIKLSLKQAREFYQKGGALKELALTAFTKSELTKISIKEVDFIFERKFPNRFLITTTFPKTESSDKIIAMYYLYKIATILNEGWIKGEDEKGYFIVPPKKQGDKTIYYHSSVTYPGIIYFKTEELAKKAIEILDDKFYDLK